MGSRDCSVGSSQGNNEHCIPMAQQGNSLAGRQRWGISLSEAEEVALVESLSLLWFECV
jgi:hypothetical protein